MERLFVLTAALACACGPAAGPASTASSPRRNLDASLVLPPTDATTAALDELERRAAGGSVDAAWTRVHFLLDAFDSARFTGSEPSRAVLFASLEAGAPGRGPAATDRVLDALLRATDDVLAKASDDAEAGRARVLLRHDRTPPGSRTEVLQRTIELSTIARSASPLATNARLRLAAVCLRALDDAADSPRAVALQRASYCLYPLYDADPAPYFADDPARRPPPPAPADLIDGTDDLLAAAENAPGRLAPVASSLRRQLQARRDALLETLPDRAAPSDLSAIAAQPAALYDQQPLVKASAQIDRDALRQRLATELAEDGRRQVAVALPAADAGAIYDVAGAARAAGAEELLVTVATEQTVQVPAGDYWHRAGGLEPGRRTVPRLGVLPIAVAEARPSDGDARATRWDPRRARLKLHVLVSNRRWVVRTPGGVLAEATGDTAARVATVRTALARVRAAFADDDAAYLIVEPGTATEQLVRVLEATTRADDGAPLLSALLLVPGLEPAGPDGIVARVARRAAATVDVAPTELASRAPALRACYQRLLDDREVAGTVRLELRGGRAKATRGPAPLRTCAMSALAAAMEADGMASAQVVFATGAQPAGVTGRR